MSGIFISYRQDDAKAWAIALRDDLAEIFGAAQVFLDKDTLHAGSWHKQIQQALERCRVVLVVIGPRWLTIADAQGRQRLHLADDVHRQEIALALSRSDVMIVPVLVDEAAMPRADQLPPELKRLAGHQARKLGDTHARREADFAVLVRDIHSVGGLKPIAQPAARDETGPKPGAKRGGRLRANVTRLSAAFALTLAAGIYGYFVNSPLNASELLFLALVFWAFLAAIGWMWARVRSTKGTKT